MKVLASLKSAKSRHPDCQVVRRHGKLFVICKGKCEQVSQEQKMKILVI